MSKHKKTRQQKVIADLRKKLSHTHQFSQREVLLPSYPSSRIPGINTYAPQQKSFPEIVTSTTTVKNDLIKSAFVTGIIILSQLILSLVLKRHLLYFPIIHY